MILYINFTLTAAGCLRLSQRNYKLCSWLYSSKHVVFLSAFWWFRFVRATEGQLIVWPFLSQHVNFFVYIPMTWPASMTYCHLRMSHNLSTSRVLRVSLFQSKETWICEGNFAFKVDFNFRNFFSGFLQSINNLGQFNWNTNFHKLWKNKILILFNLLTPKNMILVILLVWVFMFSMCLKNDDLLLTDRIKC